MTRTTLEVFEDDGSHYWLAWVVERPWIKVDGATCAEALADLDTVVEDFPDLVSSKLPTETVASCNTVYIRGSYVPLQAD